MTWRIVSVNSSSKLDLRMNYLVVRNQEIRKIHLSEISVLIIESTAVSMTAALLCELSKRKIKVIFCDEKHSPYGELVSYHNSCDSTEKIRKQISWKKETKDDIWAAVVRQKIINQRNVMIAHHLDRSEMLTEYADHVLPGDTSNREGHAAKVYFNTVFGGEMTRNTDSVFNACLNYGYSVILSAVNREISAAGYITQLGIFHDNIFNPFNFGSDLMEPFRPFVDDLVLNMKNVDELNPDAKRFLADILNREVTISGKRHYLNNALRIYCNSVFDALTEDDPELLEMCTYEVESCEDPGIL